MVAVAIAVAVFFGLDAYKNTSSLHFEDAMSSDLDAAYTAMQDTDPDAKLIAVRSSHYASNYETPTWMYLFASQTKSCSYTVFMDEEHNATAAEFGRTSFSDDTFKAIPETDAVTVDVEKAYKTAYSSIKGGKDIGTCRAYLMMYVTDESSEDAVPALTWVFTFNEPDDLKLEGVNDPATYADRTIVYVDATTGKLM